MNCLHVLSEFTPGHAELSPAVCVSDTFPDRCTPLDTLDCWLGTGLCYPPDPRILLTEVPRLANGVCGGVESICTTQCETLGFLLGDHCKAVDLGTVD